MVFALSRPSVRDLARSFTVLGAVIGTLLVLQSFGDPASEALRFDPQALLTEPWRALTGHWVHFSWSHAGLNMICFVLFAAVFQSLLRPSVLLPVGLGATMGVDLGILLFHAELAWYLGFSGVLYGLLAGVATLELRHRPTVAALVLAGLSAKLALDAMMGTPATTETFVGGRVFEEAHLYGAIGGLCAAVVLLRRVERRGQRLDTRTRIRVD